MNNQILFAVLAVLLAYTNAAAIERSDIPKIVAGTIGDGDTVVYRNWFSWPGFPEAIVGKEIPYRGSRTITAIRVTEIGNNPFSTASIIEGGVGQTFTTIWISAARSFGYNFRIEIWGR